MSGIALHAQWQSRAVPDGLWPVDTTVLRLLDGTRVYLRAVIDNFSRRILAWSLTSQLEPLANAPLLVKAMEAKRACCDDTGPQSLMVDGGVENFNQAVDDLVNQGLLERTGYENAMTAPSATRRHSFWLGLGEEE